MTENIVVSGIPGVGASQISEYARRELGDEYTLVNVGDIMLQEALEHGLADSRAELIQLRLRDQRALQRRAGEQIARKSDTGPLLINTHLVVQTPLGFIPGLNEAMLSDIDPSALVVVDAGEATIRERRKQSERSYDPFEGSIEFHKHLQNAAAFAYSLQSGVPVYHLQNEERVEESGDRLVAIANTLSELSGRV